MRDSELPAVVPAAVPYMAEALRRQRQNIADQWLAANAAPAGEPQELARRLLGVDIQDLLEHVAARLAGEGGGEVEWPVQDSAQLSSTPESPATASEMLRAYASLRSALLEQVALELGRDLRGDEVVAVDREIDELLLRQVGAALDRRIAELNSAGAAQSKYMSFLSHDLRGSLNGMILMLEVVRRELAGRPEFAESIEDLSVVRQSILDTVATMERHVVADRLRTGRFEVRPQRIPLEDLLHEAGSRVAQLAGERQARLEIQAPSSAIVEVDRELALLVLQNLLDNALRHGGTSVAVRTQRRGARWEVAIIDEGPGVDPQRLQQLMDPVLRAELRERGLGLVLATYAARAAAATIEAESTPGRGSTFRVGFLAAE